MGKEVVRGEEYGPRLDAKGGGGGKKAADGGKGESLDWGECNGGVFENRSGVVVARGGIRGGGQQGKTASSAGRAERRGYVEKKSLGSEG